eukprot:TRINITY_DN8035_c0_g1_i2.p1 TRINITY_DN8035_c0_g1~~TRINITY_DN8035_c0_g1_i2.p1  ORF type:complete len:554 (-),score=82.21 TRINITY_DN8035_c0_g1_i2:59-1720(-)
MCIRDSHSKNEDRVSRKAAEEAEEESKKELDKVQKEDEDDSPEKAYAVEAVSPELKKLGSFIQRNSERSHLEAVVTVEKLFYGMDREEEINPNEVSFTFKPIGDSPDSRPSSGSDEDEEEKKESILEPLDDLPRSEGFAGRKLPPITQPSLRIATGISRPLLVLEQMKPSEPGEAAKEISSASGDARFRRNTANELPQASPSILLRRRISSTASDIPKVGRLEIATSEGRPEFRSEGDRLSNLANRPGDDQGDGRQARSRTPPKSKDKIINSYEYFIATRPMAWESAAVRILRKAAKNIQRVKLVLLNVSHSETIYGIKATEIGRHICVDTALPFLYFYDRKVGNGGPAYKGSPPIRDKLNRTMLIYEMLLDCIDTISSYHCTVPERYKFLKERNFSKAMNGYNCAGFNMQILWTIIAIYTFLKESTKKGFRLTPSDFLRHKFPEDKAQYEKGLKIVIRAMATRPAEIMGLRGRKGLISVGADADLVAFNPYSFQDINAGSIFSKHPATYIFENQKLCGDVIDVFLRGEKIVSGSKITELPRGQVLQRNFVKR